jgi:5-methylcytosine-specific restriction endonuclease McrA
MSSLIDITLVNSTQPNEEILTVPVSVKLTKKQKEVDDLFLPDKHGCSEWVSRERIAENKILDWGKNGAARHGVYFSDKRYLWEKQGDRAITSLRTVGFSDDHLYGAARPIRKDIHEYHKKMGCVVCGSHSDLVTDHKNDLYNDPRVLDSKTQTMNDFQCLCNHCNLQKRQVSKKTKEIGKRIGATTIPSYAVFGINFVEGDETFDEKNINTMVGTYWYDPVEFAKKIKEKLKQL